MHMREDVRELRELLTLELEGRDLPVHVLDLAPYQLHHVL